MNAELDKYFEVFMKLYKDNKIHFSWRKNSFALLLQEKVDNLKEFQNFTSELARTLRKKVVEETIDDEYKIYEEYVDKLIEYDPEIKADIITRCTSNINICNNIAYEILTKRNEKLEPQCYSLLINLDLQEPSFDADLSKQINFELSIKDLRTFYKVLKEAIEKIETLSRIT